MRRYEHWIVEEIKRLRTERPNLGEKKLYPLLADIVGPQGKVYAIEIIPELCAAQRINVAHFPRLAGHIEFYCQDASGGLPDIAREIDGFDAIIATAEVRDVPHAWRQQLKTGGRLVYPKAGSLFFEIKNADETFRSRSYPGFAFVPFVEEGGTQ